MVNSWEGGTSWWWRWCCRDRLWWESESQERNEQWLCRHYVLLCVFSAGERVRSFSNRAGPHTDKTLALCPQPTVCLPGSKSHIEPVLGSETRQQKTPLWCSRRVHILLDRSPPAQHLSDPCTCEQYCSPFLIPADGWCFCAGPPPEFCSGLLTRANLRGRGCWHHCMSSPANFHLRSYCWTSLL